ncbi:MAG: hypothetical protein AAB686_02895 [Patescibacteria group bacterium]
MVLGHRAKAPNYDPFAFLSVFDGQSVRPLLRVGDILAGRKVEKIGPIAAYGCAADVLVFGEDDAPDLWRLRMPCILSAPVTANPGEIITLLGENLVLPGAGQIRIVVNGVDYTPSPDSTATTMKFAVPQSLAGRNVSIFVRQTFLSGVVSSNIVNLTVAGITAPVITSFTANPSAVNIGQSTELCVKTAGLVDTLSFDPGIGVQFPNTGGCAMVMVNQTTTFTATVTGAGGSASAQVRVSVNPPAFRAEWVVNAVDFTPRLWPGAAATIFGLNLASSEATAEDLSACPTILNGVTAIWGNTPAQICYVSPTQINLLVPAEMAPGGDAWIRVTRDNAISEWVRVLISDPPTQRRASRKDDPPTFLGFLFSLHLVQRGIKANVNVKQAHNGFFA